MRTFIYACLVLALLAIGCQKPQPQAINAPLAFYVVSDQPIDGGRFIDTQDLPKLGYVAAKPDLDITMLKEVYPQSNGLAVAFGTEDAKAFASLTEKSIGKRLLVVVGDKPASAPKIMAPIEGGCLLIQFLDQADLKRAENDLKKLIY
ncbi:MAG TPA: hypothetical protein VFV96_03275 [Verrucomicrobiae bacterium]|nr:hypothetical protein [Verrucomicrobiae bacterium]